MAIRKPNCTVWLGLTLLTLAFAASSDQVVIFNGETHALPRTAGLFRTVKQNGQPIEILRDGERMRMRPENEPRLQGESSGCRESVQARFFSVSLAKLCAEQK